MAYGNCGIGTNSSYWKPGEDFLQNTFHFPPFKNLPHEHILDDDYWKPDKSGLFQPAGVWFFMAEIKDDRLSQMNTLRNRTVVQDRNGIECVIAFYPEDGTFDYKTLKKGSTVFVTNGLRHEFLDGSAGLRIEELDTITVAPCSLSDLLQLSNVYHSRRYTRCWYCGERGIHSAPPVVGLCPATGVDGGKELKKCSACKVAQYCSRDCQQNDWRQGHRRTCKAMPLFKKLTQIDFTKYDGRAFLRPT